MNQKLNVFAPLEPKRDGDFPVGMSVGARRWPYHGAHPGCWATPLRGTVLDKSSAKAWEGTWYEEHDQARHSHLRWCEQEGLLESTVPVLWISSSGEEFVFWESSRCLRPYAEDLAEWLRHRAQAALDERQRRRSLRLVA